MNLTAPLVPKWPLRTQEFWGYATRVGFVAAGVAIRTGVQARLAATLVTGHARVLRPGQLGPEPPGGGPP